MTEPSISGTVDGEQLDERIDARIDAHGGDSDGGGEQPASKDDRVTLDVSDLSAREDYYILLARTDEELSRINGTLRGYRNSGSTHGNDAIQLLVSSNDEARWRAYHRKLSPTARAPETQFVTCEYDGETYIALELATDGQHRNYDGALVFDGLEQNAVLSVHSEDSVDDVEAVPESVLQGSLTHDGDEQSGAGDINIERLDAMIRKLELSVYPDNQWRVGPSEPSGSHHSNPLWGTHFSTDRPMRLGQTTIDANQSAEFTVRLYNYEGGEIQGVEDETTIRANGREQEITLDLHAEPGEYLLARPVYDERHDNDDYEDLPDEAFVDEDVGCALRRVEDYDGYDEDSQNGVTFYGADNPVYSDNENWYMFFDLEVATGPEAQED